MIYRQGAKTPSETNGNEQGFETIFRILKICFNNNFLLCFCRPWRLGVLAVKKVEVS